MKVKVVLFFFYLVLHSGLVSAQADTTKLNKKRFVPVLASASVAYTGSMIALGTAWYDDFGKFHFFNDNDGWGYMDKLGHVTTSYHIGRLATGIFNWTGLPHKKSIWYGGLSGFVYLTSVEMFDGFSEDWGFSPGDAASNALGSGLFIAQEIHWGEQKILTKWSYHNTPFARYRPELLGEGTEKWLKDYNGQTYWLSMNLRSLSNDKINLPDWFNLAIGYSIEGYTGANRNPEMNGDGESIPNFRRYGQIYLAPDIDFSRLIKKNNFWRHALTSVNFLKAPLPGVSYSPVEGWGIHWVVF